MYCIKCGTQNPDDVTFCSECGNNLKYTKPETEIKRNVFGTEIKPGKNLKIALAAVVGFFLLLVIISMFSEQLNNGGVYKTKNILDDVIQVEAGTSVDYKLSIPSQATLSGYFTASGGSGDDIIVYIIDETEYFNFINGDSFKTYYNSNKGTTGRISVVLPKGNYYLIYSNRFSALSNKNVKTKVDIMR